MGIEMGVFLTFGGALILLFLLGRVLLAPLKLILKFCLNSILGGVLVLGLNLIGMHFGVMIPFNLCNAAIVGILGVPGVIMLLVLCN